MKRVGAFAILIFTIIGCGDNSGTDDLNTLTTAYSIPLQSAFLIDSAIEGVTYANSNYPSIEKLNSTTDSTGKFYYTSDTSSVTLTLGKITLGTLLTSSINSDDYFTIGELLGNSRSSSIYDTKMKNMLQLLQSIDSDGDPMNGITIDSTTQNELASLGSSYDFSANTYANSTLNAIVSGLSGGYTLIDSDYAVANYEESMRTTLGLTVDTVVPAQPAVTSGTGIVTATSTYTITVRGEYGSTVYVDGAATTGTIGSTRFKSVTVPTSGTLSEGNNTYAITLNDGTIGASDALAYTITKDTTNPVFTSNATVSVDENYSTSTSFYTAAVTDATTVTYSLTAGSTGSFTIDSSTGLLYFSSPPDYESATSYSVTITATDAAGNTASQALTVNINNLNDEAPVITTASFSAINENTTSVGSVSITDADDIPLVDTYTYSLTGTNASSFTISGAGALSFNSAPDYEVQNTYYVTVVVTDSNGYSGSKSYTISLNNLDDENPVISTTNFSINENYTAIGTVSVTDPDGIYTGMTYAISGVDAGLMSISGSGVLSFGSGKDYEVPTDSDSNNVYSANVTVTDSGGNSATSTVNVTINNTNDLGISWTTAAAIGTVTAGDASTTVVASDDFTPYYSIIEDSAIGCGYNLFKVGATNGQISFKNNSTTFQMNGCSGSNVYNVKVKAYSNAADYAVRTFVITVNP